MNATRLIARALLALLLCALLLIASVAMVGALQKPNTKIPADLAGQHVDVRGVPLRVLQRGTGRDVLFIHGSPGSLEDWSPLFESLASAFRLTAYDRPGQGYSGDAGRYSYQFNAETALALIDTLKLQHVIVVGHSFGGPVALAMALHAPTTVDAYVTLDSSYYRPSRAPERGYRLIAVPWLGMGIATLASASVAPAKIRAGLPLVFGRRPPPENFVAQRTRIWSSAKVTHALALENLHAAEDLAALSPHYPEIHAPLFIVASEHPLRHAAAEQLQHDVVGSQLTSLPDTGHYLQFDEPGAVAEVIRSAAAATAR